MNSGTTIMPSLEMNYLVPSVHLIPLIGRLIMSQIALSVRNWCRSNRWFELFKNITERTNRKTEHHLFLELSTLVT